MKRKQKQAPERDPLADYREWADNRYNPGHWLGANTPPDVRGLWSTKDRRWLGLGLSIMGATLTLNALRAPSSELYTVIYGLPWLVLGLILLFSRENPKGKGK